MSRGTGGLAAGGDPPGASLEGQGLERSGRLGAPERPGKLGWGPGGPLEGALERGSVLRALRASQSGPA